MRSFEISCLMNYRGFFEKGRLWSRSHRVTSGLRKEVLLQVLDTKGRARTTGKGETRLAAMKGSGALGGTREVGMKVM
jgi:hypothetical protein